MTTIPVAPAPAWTMQPVSIALVDMAGAAIIGATLTLHPDSPVPIEMPGTAGSITVLQTDIGPFTSEAGSIDGKAVGLIATSIPISNDVDVSRQVTYTATIRSPNGGFLKGTVYVDDVTDPGVLWIGPSFVDGVVAPGDPVAAPAVTYTAFAALAADVVAVGTLAGAMPGTSFRCPWNGTAWTYEGVALTARPSARTDIFFGYIGAPSATADPAWAISGDWREDVA